MARYWQNVGGSLVELFPRKDFKSPVDGCTYGAKCFDDAEWRTTHGVLLETVSGTKPDTRFYAVTESLSLDAVRSYVGTPLALDVIKAAKRAEAKRARIAACDGGIVWNGYQVQTDGDSRREMTGVVVTINEAGLAGMKWRMGDNSTVTLSASDFKTMALTVSAHIQACFDAQAARDDAIDAYTAGQEQALIDYAVV